MHSGATAEYKRGRKAVDRQEDGKPIYARNSEGAPVCGAKIRNKPGRTCQNTWTMENGRCRLHGGATPMGLANPSTKSGAWSSAVPKGLLQNYETLLADPDLLSVRNILALHGAHILELLKTLDQGGVGRLFHELAVVVDAMEKHIARNDVTALTDLCRTVIAIVNKGKGEVETWEQIHTSAELFRKSSETEQKLLVAKEQMISSEEALTLALTIVTIVKQHVTDEKVFRAIAMDVSRKIGTKRPELPSGNPGLID